MVIGCNSEITDIKYSGFTITKIYACDGEVVYEKSTPPVGGNKFEGVVCGTTYTVACNESNLLSYLEVYDAVSTKNGLTRATIGSCVRELDDNLFNYIYPNLTDVILSDSLYRIGYAAFHECFNLSGVTIPSSVREIGAHAFSACHNISAITIPYGVTEVNEETFLNCNRLTNIIIPSTVTNIKNYAFTIADEQDAVETQAKRRTLANRSVYIYATTPPNLSSADVFESEVPNVNATYPIFVPSGSVEAYKTAIGWKDLLDINRIQAI